MVLLLLLKDLNSLLDLLPLPVSVPIYDDVVEIFHWLNEHCDLPVTSNEKSAIHRVVVGIFH